MKRGDFKPHPLWGGGTKIHPPDPLPLQSVAPIGICVNTIKKSNNLSFCYVYWAKG